MITQKERRFLKYWEEQRKGGKFSFFALYISMGTIVTTIAVAFLMSVLGLKYAYWPVPIIGLVLMVIITMLTWNTNEKQFRRIIKRVINEGKEKDSSEAAV
ncbi:hypothetical protein [Gynurincola endophyticus]|uniref:hypothetical protein n=1 Tax=Gynurincola endophyticus TaxID=2479004 RepID=UPI000F8DEB43|nr:hypothetical protein [Gynurincola endophyticus]